ncbi:hypothetical protein [Opitutus terrae]|uniref:Lipoprotein n=1 Tax=Opitutus terrae (strain DSM 11246 / JCM 15787 / PB90-1) TaxID=452637 RepID=B1ZUC4_OPITP|nr:hypothetical protein [Opitutus terrae]ACB76686.1 hypothetical protein Oter_3409 [Opitutus terrae PB90-1]
MKAKVLASLFGLALAGCVPIEWDLRDVKNPAPPLGVPAQLSHVRLAPRLLALDVLASTPPAKTRYDIGPLLAERFTGNEDAPLTLDFVAAGIRQEGGGVTSFTLSVVLRGAGLERPITVAARSERRWSYESSTREAVDRALAQLVEAVDSR